MKYLLILFLLLIPLDAHGQATKETLYLKDQISDLQKEVKEQKELSQNLLEKINELIKNQNELILQSGQVAKILENLTSTSSATKQTTFKDAFIVNKDGKLVAFIDDGLRLYEYYGGYLIGWIKPDTNEVVRNFDNSVIGVIEDDFILDETGHAIGSIERSENLRWDREKLFQEIQKKPISHYFIRIENPIPFNLSPFRYSDWASEKLEDILFFSEKKIQKLK